MLREGLPLKLGATDADDTRYDFRNLVVCNSDGSPRGGVTSPAGANLLAATSTMNINVQPFNAVEVRDNGVVLISNDAVYPLLLDGAPVANSRIDLIVAKQNDSSGTVSAPDVDDMPTIKFVKGSADPTPVPEAVPAGWVEIGTVQIPSTATATNSAGVVVKTTAPYTAAPGGLVPFRTKAELDLWTTGSLGQHANVFADSSAGNNGDYLRVSGSWLNVSSDTGWITPTLAGSWASSAGLTIQYRRKNGVVYLKGRAVSGASGTIFTLPAGFRPGLVMVEVIQNGSVQGEVTTLTLNTNGTVVGIAGTVPWMSDIRPFIADA